MHVLRASINETMQDFVASYHKEIIRALYGHGRYRLAIGYNHLFCYIN